MQNMYNNINRHISFKVLFWKPQTIFNQLNIEVPYVDIIGLCHRVAISWEIYVIRLKCHVMWLDLFHETLCLVINVLSNVTTCFSVIPSLLFKLFNVHISCFKFMIKNINFHLWYSRTLQWQLSQTFFNKHFVSTDLLRKFLQ